ncbi:uncharacterized protein B0J16DRAFT_320402 [Fusarium flagelliforme]|uniref:uncharacterized protein n=1 Tax=Fusarium flagelliforme TaxID=2675880 RepID=UPI001E8D4660|nr:uncharacterized protein B0J16DRAFT_320402 [Fusarium flagelliforme]KAH7185634.1 hypothetical protein B0J16DRAFT_320402 [Fusarium flagelliforme]
MEVKEHETRVSVDGLRSQLGNGDETAPQGALCKGVKLVVDVVSIVDDNKIPRDINCAVKSTSGDRMKVRHEHGELMCIHHPCTEHRREADIAVAVAVAGPGKVLAGSGPADRELGACYLDLIRYGSVKNCMNAVLLLLGERKLEAVSEGCREAGGARNVVRLKTKVGGRVSGESGWHRVPEAYGGDGAGSRSMVRKLTEHAMQAMSPHPRPQFPTRFLSPSRGNVIHMEALGGETVSNGDSDNVGTLGGQGSRSVGGYRR